MKILIVGSGGREHALGVKIKASPLVSEVFILPGNSGIARDGIKIINSKICDFEQILKDIKDNSIEFVIIGPEVPLTEGIVDYLSTNNIRVLGPTKKAAMLESSKIYSKKFMNKYNIPTASYKSFDNYESALAGLKEWDFSNGIVIKSDSLAAGKGVVVTDSKSEAEETLYNFMKNKECSVKTDRVIFEEKLLGEELSVLALCDGDTFKIIGYAKDYKRVFDNDIGPNTGGMGSISSMDLVNDDLVKLINEKVLTRVLEGMKSEGHPYKGILFAGLMINENNPRVIEFNVRAGDPETQSILHMISGDIFPPLYHAADKFHDIDEISIKENSSAVHVVIASKGYPSTSNSKMELEKVINCPSDEKLKNDSYIYYSGVKSDSQDRLVNSGGRVLGITAVSKSRVDAIKRVYELINETSFDGSHCRSDIGS